MTTFSSNKTQVLLDFQWDFTTYNGVYGVLMPKSIGVGVSTSETIDKITFTMFYMKTWYCPDTPV